MMSNSARGHAPLGSRELVTAAPEDARHDWYAGGPSTMPTGHMYFKVQMRRIVTNGGLTLCQHTVRDRNRWRLT
jgi:hypothetical protein